MAIRPKKEIQRRSSEGITEDAYQYYSSGPFFGGEDFEKGKTEEELKAFWNKHRQAIMDRCLEENRAKGRVGNRPPAFWDYDMPEPQRETPPREFEAQQVWNHATSEYGWFESDFDYLKRLNLLQDWELKG
jgi:hypothetical protein